MTLRLPVFQARFQVKDRVASFKTKETRQRKLRPITLFHSVVQLVAGANFEGYSHALLEVFRDELSMEQIPSPSSLCRARQKISFRFFESIFDDLVHQFDSHRPTFHGLHVYAIDGQQEVLPRTPDIVEAGFTGKAFGKYRESYMPRGYFTHAYDVLSRTSKDVRFGPDLNEIRDAKEMLQSFEKNSLSLYDRLYFHPDLARGHEKYGHFYLARCKRNATKEIAVFFQEKRKKKTVQIDGMTVHLIKVKNPRPDLDEEKDRWIVFATNLPKNWLKPKRIAHLYRLRWEVENSFRQLTAITKIEQWHSKFVNGIYQELFALLWLINFTQMQVHLRQKKPKNPLRLKYQRVNFKLIFNYFKSCLRELFKGIHHVLDGLATLIKRSTQTRVHFKRRYPREIKSPASPYSYNNTRWTI